MVKLMVNLTKEEEGILNIVKGKFRLKSKAQAVSLVIDKFDEEFLSREIRPEYLKELKKISKGKFHKISSIEELRRMTEDV